MRDILDILRSFRPGVVSHRPRRRSPWHRPAPEVGTKTGDETLKMVSIRSTAAQVDALNALSELTGDSVNLLVRKSVDLYIRNFMSGHAADEAMRRTERALEVLSAAAGSKWPDPPAPVASDRAD